MNKGIALLAVLVCVALSAGIPVTQKRSFRDYIQKGESALKKAKDDLENPIKDELTKFDNKVRDGFQKTTGQLVQTNRSVTKRSAENNTTEAEAVASEWDKIKDKATEVKNEGLSYVDKLKNFGENKFNSVFSRWRGTTKPAEPQPGPPAEPKPASPAEPAKPATSDEPPVIQPR